MARLSITTFKDAKEVAYGRPHQVDSVNVDVTSAQSDPIDGTPGDVMRVRLCADVAVDVTWGEDPTAEAGDSTYLPANSTEYFGIKVGDRIAVIEHA